MKNHIVVLPYQETSRLFHASITKNEEAFIGQDGKIVYYQSQAKTFDAREACKLAVESGNNMAFVRQV